MEKFEELQSIWDHQANELPKQTSFEIIERADAILKAIRVKHFFTIGILSILVITLSAYYFWIFNDKIAKQIIGLGLMIFVIILRILLEIISIFKFKNIEFTNSLKNYTIQLISFYNFRKIIHYWITPFIYLAYCIGFISLLPLFKTNFSTGFYYYIVLSGALFLIFFSLLSKPI